MKHLFLALALTHALAFAEEIKVSKMSPKPEMDRAFILKSSHPHPVTLDCQSFIQGLTVGAASTEDFFMLEPYECEDLYGRIQGSLKKFKKHCITVDQAVVTDYTCR